MDNVILQIKVQIHIINTQYVILIQLLYLKHYMKVAYVTINYLVLVMDVNLIHLLIHVVMEKLMDNVFVKIKNKIYNKMDIVKIIMDN